MPVTPAGPIGPVVAFIAADALKLLRRRRRDVARAVAILTSGRFMAHASPHMRGFRNPNLNSNGNTSRRVQDRA
jgi:hypothetical protein